MAPVVERLIDIDNVELGEGPHWDAETQTLYFVDIFGHYIHKYVPSSKKHTKAHIGIDKNVSIIVPVKGKTDQFVITTGREIALVTWDGESEKVSKLEKLHEVDENTKNAFNDGKCDPYGRLWAGTMSQEKFDIPLGGLYSLQNNKVTKHDVEVSIANGLAFDSDRKKFYYIDSFRNTIDEYDYDVKNGTISNRKTIYTLKEGSIDKMRVLDGMTIDTEGNLWVVVYNMGKVIKIDPRKPDIVQDTIQFPSKQITSVTFGGPNLDDLYVTSARLTFNAQTLYPEDGFIYRIRGLNAKGLPGVRVVL